MPPKLLRGKCHSKSICLRLSASRTDAHFFHFPAASFCTFLRSHDEGVDQELLDSVAKAMKHKVTTGGRCGALLNSQDS